MTDPGPVPRAGSRACAAAGGGGKLLAQANEVMNEALFALKHPEDVLTEHRNTGVCRAAPELVVCMNSRGFLQLVPGNTPAGVTAPLKRWGGSQHLLFECHCPALH